MIGRATEVSISVPDTSVSRQHLALRLRDGRWVAEDLGSGNGTLVNGAAISAETPLAHGDVLTLGDTEFSFIAGAVTAESTARRPNPLAEGAPPPVRRAGGRPVPRGRQGPDPATRAKRKKMLAIGLVVLVVALLPLAWLKQQQVRDQERQAAFERAQQQERMRLGKLAQEGKSLLRERKWAEAKAQFEQLLSLSPENQESKDYLAVIERESLNQQRMDEARKGVSEGKIAVAQQALDQLTNTLMHEEERKLKAELSAKVIARVTEARALMAGKDRAGLASAKDILEDILVAFPEDRDARVALEDVEKLLAVPEPDSGPKQPRAPSRPKPWDAAVAAYMSGDLEQAIAGLTACGKQTPHCRELLKKVEDFGALNRRVDSLDAAGLGRLLTLDRSITGGPQSKLAQSAGLRAANAYYRSGAAAMAAGQWSRASQYVQRALKANPNHDESQRLASQLREKAKDVYMNGYMQRQTAPDVAREQMRQVMEMAPPGDEYHQKAQRQLTLLEQ